MMLIKNINSKKLYTELAEIGVQISKMQNDAKEGEQIAMNTWVLFEDGTDMELVQQIIDAHDPTPLPPPKAETEILKERLQTTEDALLGLMDFITMGGM